METERNENIDHTNERDELLRCAKAATAAYESIIELCARFDELLSEPVAADDSFFDRWQKRKRRRWRSRRI